jgi:hypothetical protein
MWSNGYRAYVELAFFFCNDLSGTAACSVLDHPQTRRQIEIPYQFFTEMVLLTYHLAVVKNCSS